MLIICWSYLIRLPIHSKKHIPTEQMSMCLFDFQWTFHVWYFQKKPGFFQKKSTPCHPHPRLPSRTARTSEMVTLVWGETGYPPASGPLGWLRWVPRAIGKKNNQSFGRRLQRCDEKFLGWKNGWKKLGGDFPGTTQLGSLFQVWIGGLWKCGKSWWLHHLSSFWKSQGLNQCGKSSHEPFSTLPLSHCHLTTAKSQDSRFQKWPGLMNVDDLEMSPSTRFLAMRKWLMNIFSRVASITPRESPSHPFASRYIPALAFCSPAKPEASKRKRARRGQPKKRQRQSYPSRSGRSLAWLGGSWETKSHSLS